MSTVLRGPRGSARGTGARWALSDCTLEVPAGRVVGLVGPNGAGKSTFLNLAVGHADAVGRRRSRCSAPGPPAADAQRAKVGFVGQDTPTYAGLSVADHLRLGARLNPGWDAALARGPDRAARPRPDAARRPALRRPARPARAHARHRQATRAAAARRAGGQPRPAGPAGVPAGPDGGGRRPGAQRRALLPPGLRRRARLRLPGRAGRLPGAGRRRHRAPAGHPPPADRSAPRPRHAARRPARRLAPATPTGSRPTSSAPTDRSSTRPGRSARSPWRTSCWPTWAARHRRAPPDPTLEALR